MRRFLRLVVAMCLSGSLVLALPACGGYDKKSDDKSSDDDGGY